MGLKLRLIIFTLIMAQSLSVFCQTRTNSPRSFHVPYRLTDTRHILVRAKVEGKGPFNFIVDTGAPEVYLSVDAASKLGWKLTDETQHSASLEIEGGLTTTKVQVREDDPAPLVGMNSTGVAGFKLDGILGYTMLARYKIEIDFTKSYMVWTEQPTRPKPPASIHQMLKGKPAPSMKGVETLNDIARSAGSLMPKGTFNPPLRGSYGLMVRRRDDVLEVTGALIGSPAERAKFAIGDLIRSVTVGEREPRTIRNIDDLRSAIDLATPNQPLIFLVTRESKSIQLVLQSAGRDF